MKPNNTKKIVNNRNGHIFHQTVSFHTNYLPDSRQVEHKYIFYEKNTYISLFAVDAR